MLTGWVVVTSWSAEVPGYGARMVLTSVETGSAPEPTRDLQDSVAWGREKLTGGPVEQRQVQPIFPYAAVPVRGGWLVIQL